MRFLNQIVQGNDTGMFRLSMPNVDGKSSCVAAMWRREKLLIQFHLSRVKNTDYVSLTCKQSSVTAWVLLMWFLFDPTFSELHPDHSICTTQQDLTVLFDIIIRMILTKGVLRLEQVLMPCLLCNSTIIFNEQEHNTIALCVCVCVYVCVCLKLLFLILI